MEEFTMKRKYCLSSGKGGIINVKGYYNIISREQLELQADLSSHCQRQRINFFT